MSNQIGQSSNSSTTDERCSKLSKSQVEELIKLLGDAATILGETASGPRILGVVAMIEDLPFDAVRSCLSEWPKKHDWFPKPRQIREVVLGNQQAMQEAEAELAWHRVIGAADRWTPDSDFEYPANSGLTEQDEFALESIGGLVRLFHLSIEGSDWSFARRDFCHAWKSSLLVVGKHKELAAGEREGNSIVVRSDEKGS